MSTRQSREADYSKLIAYRDRRQSASEESFNRGGEIEEDINADNLSKIKVRFLVPKTELIETETKVIMIGEKFYEYQKKELRQIKTVKLQFENIEEGQETNILYNNGNDNILDKDVAIKEDYVIVYEDVKSVDKSKEYFIDFNEGTVILYRIDKDDKRVKVKGLVNAPKLI